MARAYARAAPTRRERDRCGCCWWDRADASTRWPGRSRPARCCASCGRRPATRASPNWPNACRSAPRTCRGWSRSRAPTRSIWWCPARRRRWSRGWPTRWPRRASAAAARVPRRRGWRAARVLRTNSATRPASRPRGGRRSTTPTPRSTSSVAAARRWWSRPTGSPPARAWWSPRPRPRPKPRSAR